MRKATAATEQPAKETPNEEALALARWQKLLTVTATLLTLFAVFAVALYVGVRIHHTILLFALGGLVAYALEPLVVRVRALRFGKGRRQLNRTWSTLAVFAGIFLVFAGGVAWLGDAAGHQFRAMQDHSEEYRSRAKQFAANIDSQYLQPHGITFSLAQTIENPPPEISRNAEEYGREALPIIAHTVSTAAESAVVLLIAVYFLIFGSEMKERANMSLPPHLLAYALPWEEDVSRILGGFVRGQCVLALVTGACAAIGLFLCGVKLWLILGLFTVIASLIPVFGPYIAAVPAVLAALLGPTRFTNPMGAAITVLVLFIIINEVGSKILYPKLVGGALNLHEMVVLFVLFAGLELGGIVGAFLAAPIAALAIVTVFHLYRLWQELPEGPMALRGKAVKPGG